MKPAPGRLGRPWVRAQVWEQYRRGWPFVCLPGGRDTPHLRQVADSVTAVMVIVAFTPTSKPPQRGPALTATAP